LAIVASGERKRRSGGLRGKSPSISGASDAQARINGTSGRPGEGRISADTSASVPRTHIWPDRARFRSPPTPVPSSSAESARADVVSFQPGCHAQAPVIVLESRADEHVTPVCLCEVDRLEQSVSVPICDLEDCSVDPFVALGTAIRAEIDGAKQGKYVSGRCPWEVTLDSISNSLTKYHAVSPTAALSVPKQAPKRRLDPILQRSADRRVGEGDP
jgi:hypothetical protein